MMNKKQLNYDPIDALKIKIEDLYMVPLDTSPITYKIVYLPYRVAAVGPTIEKAVHRLQEVIKFYIEAEIDNPGSLQYHKYGWPMKRVTKQGRIIQ